MVKTYVPDAPCIHGHSERYVRNRECVDCTKIKTLKYRVANREKVLGIYRDYYAANRERRRSESSFYRATHRRKYLASKAKTHAKHYEKNRVYGAAYAKKHAQRFAVYAAARRAKVRRAPGRGLTPSVWRYILNAALGICAYCNERKPLTIEHIEPLMLGGAHDPENIAAACKRCNYGKNDTPLLIWLASRIR